jgi:hypothetical protein
MSTTVRLAIALVALAAASTACSEPDDRPTPSPSSAFPGTAAVVPTGARGPAIGTGPTSGEASGPDVASVELSSGRITMQLSGEVEAETTLDEVTSALYAPPPGALAIVWASEADANVVGLGGTSFVGTRPTSATLTLTITAQTGGDIANFVSVNGECEVSIDVATGNRLAGSFTCTGLISSAGRVADVSASFEAAR